MILMIPTTPMMISPLAPRKINPINHKEVRGKTNLKKCVFVFIFSLTFVSSLCPSVYPLELRKVRLVGFAIITTIYEGKSQYAEVLVEAPVGLSSSAPPANEVAGGGWTFGVTRRNLFGKAWTKSLYLLHVSMPIFYY